MPTTVAFAHATGFCGEVWRPVVSALPEDFETRVWDFPSHGSAPKWKRPIDWWDLGAYTLRQVGEPAGPVIGVGHSMGGAAILMAEIKAPGTFAELLLIEPIVFPPPYGPYEGSQTRLAAKRRNHFESRQDARDNFADKLPFSAWHPSALDGYLECGLVDTPAGTVLACNPRDEVAIYRAATQHRVWELLGSVRAPVTILAGSSSDTHTAELVRRMASQIPEGEFGIIPGTGHFLPMELPDLVANRIERIGARSKR